ncbi:calcium-activated chloride channel regulator 4-like [Elysia marginata]|uniref:Calcium-activated chloride channel regulator 4-like n=1 Tax=Elysia marginata TaxID=1093978 RepID=A0AAV4FCJ7_9GAST|nr:calcium-activated chloride channel regulator 4-like [Elysia marginata]
MSSKDMAKATIAMAKCADELALRADYKDKLTSLTDAMTLLGHTHQSITNLRRESMLYALPYDFKSLCDATTEASNTLLYGDDIRQNLEDAKEQRRLTASLQVQQDNKNRRPLHTSGIVVHALAYGQKAEQSIADLSHDTGGKTFFYSRRANSTALIDGLAATVATENSVVLRPGVPHSILTDARTVSLSAPLFGEFYIDSTVGRETSLTFSFSNHIEVKVQSPGPNPEVYSNEKQASMFRYNTESNILKVILPGTVVPGKWSYTVTTNATKSHITLNIQSKPSHVGRDVLLVRFRFTHNS